MIDLMQRNAANILAISLQSLTPSAAAPSKADTMAEKRQLRAGQSALSSERQKLKLDQKKITTNRSYGHSGAQRP